MKLVKILLVSIAVIVAAGFAALFAFDFWSRPDSGTFDRFAIKRIRKLCGRRADCQVTMRDLSQLDWDTFYEFDYPSSPESIAKITGAPMPAFPRADLQRVIVLLKNGRVVFHEDADEGIESSIAGEVFFHCPGQAQEVVKCDSGAVFRVTSFETQGDPASPGEWPGTSYDLQQIR